MLTALSICNLDAQANPDSPATDYEILSATAHQTQFSPAQHLYRNTVTLLLKLPAARFLLAPTGFQPDSIAAHYGLTLDDAQMIATFWQKQGEAQYQPAPTLEKSYEVTAYNPVLDLVHLPYFASVYGESYPATEHFSLGGTAIYLHSWEINPAVFFRIFAHEFAIRVSRKTTTLDQLGLASESIQSLTLLEQAMLTESLKMLAPILHLNRVYQLESALVDQVAPLLALPHTNEDLSHTHASVMQSAASCFVTLHRDLTLYKRARVGSTRYALEPEVDRRIYLTFLEELALESTMPDLSNICQRLIQNSPVPFSSSGPGPRVGGF